MFSIFKIKKSQRGQAILLVAVAMVGMIGMIGLLIDGGDVFIQSSRLKRAIDAAAVSAALQFREGYSEADLEAAAQEFIMLNENETYDIEVFTCASVDKSDPNDPNKDLCTVPPRKLVRITGTKKLEFNFLPVLGFDGTTVTTASVGEAASVDVVIVLDTSMSMADQTDGIDGFSGIGDDPVECTANRNCQPFEDIKDVAKDFVETLFFPYDRVSVVTFDRSPTLHLYNGISWQEDKADAQALIDGLKIYPLNTFSDPTFYECNDPNPAHGPCLLYNASRTTLSIGCMAWQNSGTNPKDPISCTSSNIGGGLAVAGNQFAQEPIREDALWVVILLAGGPANATSPVPGYPYGTCPSSTHTQPFCRDDYASVRHHFDTEPLLYDGDDYARDMADFIVDPINGQGAVIYAIGLGEKVRNDRTRNSDGDPDIGEQFLDYAATKAGGVDDQGIYYYAPTVAELREVFRDIAENIATRISQ